jgi:hypothetical protein
MKSRVTARLALVVLLLWAAAWASVGLSVARSPSDWIFIALVGGIPIIGYLLLRSSRGGILSGWREPLMDASLSGLSAGTPEEWVRGRGALGAGSGGAADLKAAAVRAVWWEPEPSAAVAELRWRVSPDPPTGALARATRKATSAAKRALPGRGGVRVTGGLRRQPGPDLVVVRLVVRGQTDEIKTWVRPVEEAFAAEFGRRLGPAFQLDRLD